jgi:hypothetical protein
MAYMTKKIIIQLQSGQTFILLLKLLSDIYLSEIRLNLINNKHPRISI